MTLHCISNPKAEAVRLLNEAFDVRLKGHRAKATSPALADFHTARADALMKAARELENEAQESER